MHSPHRVGGLRRTVHRPRLAHRSAHEPTSPVVSGDLILFTWSVGSDCIPHLLCVTVGVAFLFILKPLSVCLANAFFPQSRRQVSRLLAQASTHHRQQWERQVSLSAVAFRVSSTRRGVTVAPQRSAPRSSAGTGGPHWRSSPPKAWDQTTDCSTEL